MQYRTGTSLQNVGYIYLLEESIFTFLALSLSVGHSCARPTISRPTCHFLHRSVLIQAPLRKPQHAANIPSERRVSILISVQTLFSSATPVDLATTTPHLYCLSPRQNMQRPIQRHRTVPSPIHKLSSQSRKTGAPSNWQATS